jgi:predicted ATPase
VKLLDAIAALRSDASGKTPSVDATTTSSAPRAHPEDRAERRQVTVMFSDLVSSTALSARMDPEEERAARLTHNDTTQVKLDKLDALLARTSTSIQDASLFADMLSLPNDGRYPTLDPDPQRRRQRTLEALNLQMEVLSRSNPVLMIVEDVHWSDPTSVEAFGRACPPASEKT